MTFNLHYLSAKMMILLQNKDEKILACDAENAQIWNFSAPEIVLRPCFAQTRCMGELTALLRLPLALLQGKGREGGKGRGRTGGREGKGKREGRLGPKD